MAEYSVIECKLGIVREDYSRIRQLFIVGQMLHTKKEFQNQHRQHIKYCEGINDEIISERYSKNGTLFDLIGILGVDRQQPR